MYLKSAVDNDAEINKMFYATEERSWNVKVSTASAENKLDFLPLLMDTKL